MDNIKNDTYYVEKIKNDLAFIIDHTKNIDQSRLEQDEVLLDSMLFRLIQISENVRRMSESYKEEHTNIPWTAIYGLRNRLVHDYGNVDLEIIYSTLKNDIPELLNILKEC